MVKPKFVKYHKFKSYIDETRHTEKLKEIEKSIQSDAFGEDESLEEGLEEEEMYLDAFDDHMSLSEGDPALTLGRIDLSFPETKDEFELSNPQCYPPSYYTLSPKEKLLLLYAENFRKQFLIPRPKGRPLVLAVPNECRVQKFVCQTIRPTGFAYTPLIGSCEEIAKFVADFVEYEPLEDPYNLPTRLISPDTLLRKRHGNSYEMATLLCSMLIGAGFPAVVVSGVARTAVVENNQCNTPYPYPIEEIEVEEKEPPVEVVGVKYKLRPLPDLESHLDEEIAEIYRQKAEEEKAIKDEIIRKEALELELVPVDRYHYRRVHAWVAIIDNAPWSIKPRIMITDENGDTVEAPPTARFIEPSTGFICETACKQYLLVDSVWDDANYWINKQKYYRVGEIRWDLRVNEDWEHMLAGEPPEMRLYKETSDENIGEKEHDVLEEKHLDTIRSWVSKLHIGLKDFEDRFPKLEKRVRYMGAIHERFSPYTQRDGKVMQVTLFKDAACTEPDVRYEFFENRSDLLKQIKYTYDDDQFIESFHKGRQDCLKAFLYYSDSSKEKIAYFYSASRIDFLNCVKVYPDRIVLQYKNRSDRCWYREFQFKSVGSVLKKAIEKYTRNLEDNIRPNDDIAERTFLFHLNRIGLKFHYAHGALTASTIDINKPPKPDYGKELIYDEKYIKSYKANPLDKDRTALELYKLLLDQLSQEDRIKKQFERIQDDINTIFDQRRMELKNPKLTFSIFDPLRNGAARAIRMKQIEEEEELKREIAMKPADFLAPYLVPFKNKTKLTQEESLATYNACLTDLKTRFVNLLNNLQRRYEDLTSESKSLKRFINKFENQFNNYDYERLMQDAKHIELKKRMVQQRLTITHEQSQKKYETVKAALLKDTRLDLPKPEVKKEETEESE